MKKNLFYSSLLITLLVTSLFAFILIKNFSSIDENIKLKNTVILELETSNEIDFSKFHISDWDKLYILTPYSNINITFENYKLNYSNLNSKIESSDDINLILFVKSNNIIDFIELPRMYGFSNLNSPIELNKENAKFSFIFAL